MFFTPILGLCALTDNENRISKYKQNLEPNISPFSHGTILFILKTKGNRVVGSK